MIIDPTDMIPLAQEDEPVFILLGRDPAAAAAIHAWIEERKRLGLNHSGDLTIEKAVYAAALLEYWSTDRSVPQEG